MSLQTKTGLFSMESFHTKTPVSTMAAGACACSCSCGCACVTCCSQYCFDPSQGVFGCWNTSFCAAGCSGSCAG